MRARRIKCKIDEESPTENLMWIMEPWSKHWDWCLSAQTVDGKALGASAAIPR